MSFRILVFFLMVTPLMAQYPAPKITVGPERISMHDYLTVTVTVYGSDYALDDFPELAGFERGKRTVAHSETQIDGRKTELHTITKYYSPIEGGEFIIPPFEIEVNRGMIRSEAARIIVEDDEEGYADLLIDIDDADFVVECSKKEIFVGEGVKIRLSFYSSAKNTVNWQFPKDIGDQVEALARKIKPENSLESRNIISSIGQREEYIKGVKYFVYDLFEAVYYPLNNHNMTIPALTLRMNKGENRSAPLNSKPRVIRVKELPAHPLRDKVPVGTFRLKENMQGGEDKLTGESFNFGITLEGQGNMDVLNFGKIENDKTLDFFESGVRLQQEGGKLAGSKVFNYKILPKVAGDYDLGSYFSLIYFNIKTARYDTLMARWKIRVTGSTIVSKNNLVKDIYTGIDNLRTDKNEFNARSFLRVFANFILIFMVMTLIYIWKKK